MGDVLLVDDDRFVVRSLARAISGELKATGAFTFREALRLLRDRSWDGFVFDVTLDRGADGDGYDLLSVARASQRRRTPAMILSGTLSREHANRAARLGALYVVKPFSKPDIEPFMAAVAEANTRRADALLKRAEEAWSLTQRESDVLRMHLVGEPRDTFLQRHAIALSTYKSHVSSLLRKADSDGIDNLVLDLFRGAWSEDPPSGDR